MQCGDWCRKNFKDPQEVVNKPVDVEEGKKDGAAGVVDQVADQVNRGIGYWFANWRKCEWICLRKRFL